MAALTQRIRTDGGVQSVALTVQIIEAMVTAKTPRGVTELSQAIGTSKARVFRHLNTLQKLGYAEHDTKTARYRIGPRLAELGAMISDQFGLLSLAGLAMNTVAQKTGLTVVLSKVDGDAVYPVAQIEGTTLIALRLKLGAKLGLHHTAQGKLLMAFGRADILEQRIAKGLKPITPQTITSPARLRREIKTVREQGWASGRNETTLGLDGLAVPVFDRTRTLVATLALLGTVSDLAAPPQRSYLTALVSAARDITARLPAPNPAV